jgi:hypothetical protein
LGDRLSDAEFGKNLANLSRQLPASSNCRFEFKKRSQYFIRTHNETLSVVAVHVSNPDCASLRINRRDVTQAPTAFLEIVNDYLADQPAALGSS